jgi:asparagine synthase (glutamine-hydrolysing)
MPRYLKKEQLWGLLLGCLYESEPLTEHRKNNRDTGTDLEVIADMFRAGDLLEKLPALNGAFFVVLWDPLRQELIAANDRFGLYPMHWSESDNRFCLANRALCSVISGVVDGRWDISGVAQVLTTNDLVGEETLIQGVKAFPQATMMVKDRTRISWTQYWHYDYTPRYAGMAIQELGQELGRLFLRSARRQTAGIDRVGVTLSGGLDSRCIVAASAKVGVPVETFTWGIKSSADRHFARRVAAKFGTIHHDCDYEYCNFEKCSDVVATFLEGTVNVFDAHMLAHLHIIDGKVDLILNGYAGDLILGGSYLRRKWMQDIPDNVLGTMVFESRISALPEAELHEAMPVSRAQRPSELYHQLLSDLRPLRVADRIDRFFLENRVRRHTSVGTVVLRSVVESAACFFDYDLVDLTTGIPAVLRREHRVYLEMMKQCFPEALKVPWQRTFLPPNVPEWISILSKGVLKVDRLLERRLGRSVFPLQQSPVDFAGWLRGPLKNWMESICHGAYRLADEILLPRFCSQMWQDHVSGHDRTIVLGTIATLRGFSRALERAKCRLPATSRLPIEVTKDRW